MGGRVGVECRSSGRNIGICPRAGGVGEGVGGVVKGGGVLRV